MMMNGLRIVLLLLALLCAAQITLTAVMTCREDRETLQNKLHSPRPRNLAEAADRIIGPFRTHLKGQASVGYLSSHPLTDQPASDRSFSAVQYALAPTLVLTKRGLSWVVARFDSQSDLNQALADGAYEIMLNPQPGIALLRRRDASP